MDASTFAGDRQREQRRATIPVWVVLASTAAAVAALTAVLVAWDRSVRRGRSRCDGVVASPRFFERRWNATTAAGFRVVVVDDFATDRECTDAARVADATFMRQPRQRRTAPMDARRPLERRLLRRAENAMETRVDGRPTWVRVGAAPFAVAPAGQSCLVLCCDDDVETLVVEPCGLRLPGKRARCFWFYWAPGHAESANVRALANDDGDRRAIVALLSS